MSRELGKKMDYSTFAEELVRGIMFYQIIHNVHRTEKKSQFIYSTVAFAAVTEMEALCCACNKLIVICHSATCYYECWVKRASQCCLYYLP